MPGWIGPWELLIVGLVVLLIFGPKRLPQLGRSLGRGVKELRGAIPSFKDDEEETPQAQPRAELKAGERDNI